MTPDIAPVLEKYTGAGRDQLIPVLQEVQDRCGYISKESVVLISKQLGLPPSKVYGVATFYNQFRFHPKGKYHFLVCRGTACHVKGSLKVLETIQKQLNLKPGETSRDRMFSFEVVACMGACGLAPVVNVNGEFHAKATPQRIKRIIQECREKEQSNEQ